MVGVDAVPVVGSQKILVAPGACPGVGVGAEGLDMDFRSCHVAPIRLDELDVSP